MRMKWALEEDEIVCAFYLSHYCDWRTNISLLMKELSLAGYTNRDESSAKMRVSNYAYLHTGVGLSNASKQTQTVYERLKKEKKLI